MHFKRTEVQTKQWSPRVTGNLTERNQTLETYPFTLLGHRRKKKIINHWYPLFISKEVCSENNSSFWFHSNHDEY